MGIPEKVLLGVIAIGVAIQTYEFVSGTIADRRAEKRRERIKDANRTPPEQRHRAGSQRDEYTRRT